ncbi:Hypothetical protein MVR_LOCUS235 [uncultured virus]|nr:Hypothetical protein MVR_LOCUS235 [uncultured virus]
MNKCWTAKGPIMPSADEVTTILIKKSEIEDIPLIDKSEIVPIPEPVIEADTVTTPSPLDLLSEMIQRQITDGCIDKKLDINDMKRICKYINTSIFGTDCCLWQGYITNQSSANKGTYVNFYFQERKVALHRLLYDNFVEEVSKENEYIKFTCSNAGTCCNVNHMSKHRYEAKVPTKPEAKPVCKQSPVVAHRNISDIGHMMITNKLPAKTDMKICGNTTAVMEDNNYNSNTLYQSNEFGAKSTDSGQEVNASEPVSSTGVGGYSWPQLTAKNINTTFKVVGDLKEGLKVKVVDDTCLAVDDAYISSFSRYMSGQSKEKTMSFLDHLLSESKRIIYALLSDIRTSYANSNGNNDEVNNKLSELRNLHRNLNIFLHKFDAMKNVYKSDSVAYATFGNIRNNFYTFEDSFYRELVLGSVRH